MTWSSVPPPGCDTACVWSDHSPGTRTLVSPVSGGSGESRPDTHCPCNSTHGFRLVQTDSEQIHSPHLQLDVLSGEHVVHVDVKLGPSLLELALLGRHDGDEIVVKTTLLVCF